MKKSKLWLGLSGVTAFIFVLILSATLLANNYVMLINDALGITTGGLTLTGSSYGTNDEGYWKLIKDSYDFCVQELEDGAVMLKNDGALPLEASERNVTLFGNNSAHTIYRSGAGGPTPNYSFQVDMRKAFKEGGFQINETLYNAYANSGVAVNTNTRGEVAQSFYTEDLKATFNSNNDVAIVTFARYGTENTDPQLVVDGRGYFALGPNEEALMQMIKDSGKFDKIVVLLNGALPMELDWLDKYNVNACIWFGNPGYYGLPGVVNLLKGDANPSGRTVETFANNTLNSPATRNFGSYTFTFDSGTSTDRNFGTHYVVYKEGIYVGYKYYETRYEDCILDQGGAKTADGKLEGATEWKYGDEVSFPFGFGLSYSTYTQKLDSVTYDSAKDTFTATVTVKNTNNKAGKEVVQLYTQLPYTDYDKTNGLEKSAIQLVGYEKVEIPAGGEKQVEITFDRYLMASYDIKANGGKGGYIFEPGKYYFAVGNGAHEALNNILAVKGATGLVDHNGKAVTGDTNCVKEYDPNLTAIDTTSYKASVHNDKVNVENQFEDADLNYWADEEDKITYLTRNDWTNTFPTEVATLHANANMAENLNMAQYKKADNAPSYASLRGIEYEATLEAPIDFIDMKGVPYDDPKWDDFLSQMSLVEMTISMADARGIAGVDSINKPMNAIAEGPEGLLAKFKYGDERACTGFATLPTVTATWDHKMQTRFGELFGEEAIFSGVAMVNAPGCNIIRSPYTSRASEYLSEDAILSYYSVSNIIKAMRSKGLICNVKHCALNNQETHRQGVATFANEQSIREIYLRPFEGALTRGEGLGIMTSYNRIGLRYAATHKTLMQTVMRGEWGYEGSIIDDALQYSSKYSVTEDMIMAGTNIFCLDGGRGKLIREAVTNADDGDLFRAVKESNHRIFYALLHSSMAGSIGEGYVYEDHLEWWQSLLIAINVILGAVAAGAVVMYVMTTYVKPEKAAQEV